jgi:hypothetical protein
MVIIVLASLMPRRLLGLPFRTIRVTARNIKALYDVVNVSKSALDLIRNCGYNMF